MSQPKLPPFLLLLLPVLLIALGAAVFTQTLQFGFTNLDDNIYVVDNAALEQGLSADGIRWAFTNREANLWMPVTWLSFLADRQFHGPDARGFHLTNVLLHLASTVLLLLVLRRWTGTLWRAAFVAALFAIHPLHVESVAWVAERKDVLSGFFFLLALQVYLGRGGPLTWPRYAGTLLLFALAMMAKPMTVTLPVVLLLIDFSDPGERRPLMRLLLEKIPFVLLAAAMSVATYLIVQTREIGAPDPIPLFERIGQAIAFYALYLGRMFYPVGLSVFYPPEGLLFEWTRIAVWALLLVSLTGAGWQFRNRLRFVWLGWLWYLAMLLPVVGLVQGGMQLMSDRYFYLPSIGLFVALAWLLDEAVRQRSWLRWPVVALTVAAVLAGAALAHRQTAVWRDSGTLFRHALAVNEENYLAHLNLGVMLDDAGRSLEALPHLRRAVELRRDAVHQFNLANALFKLERTAEAAVHFRGAVKQQPEFPEAHNNLGIALARMGDLSAARSHFETAIEQQPDYAGAWYNLGLVQLRQGQTSAAAASFRRTVQLEPGHLGARQRLDSLQVGGN